MSAKFDRKTKIEDKDLHLRELKTVTLQIWNGTGYYDIDAEASGDDLRDWMNGSKRFKKASQLVSEASAAPPTEKPCTVQIDMMLGQLQALAHGV
jgi:hypothetical protein